jgi:hypothetical protein
MKKIQSRLLFASMPITGVCAVLIVLLATHATKIQLTHIELLTYVSLMMCLYSVQLLSLVPMLRKMRADRDLGSGQLKLS